MEQSTRKSCIAGAIGWVLICIILVVLRGTRWDEEYEMAQIVLGHLPYPLEHPMVRATRNALNLQIYISSLVQFLSPGPHALCFLRNVLFLIATVLPVYAIAAVIGRRALLAHLAAVLVLLAVHEEFDGCKRLVTWPHFFSTGHIGRGYAMLTFAALLAGWWRTGFGMLGLMPCVHIAHMPVVLGFTILRVAGAWRSQRRVLLRAIIPLLCGLAVCGLIWLSKGYFTVPEPTSGPYFSDADPGPIWEGFLAQDVHRALPGGPVKYGNSFFVLGAALVLSAMAARLEWTRARALGPWFWCLVFVFGCACAVWGVMAIHTWLGRDVPYVFIAWMPYRFTNHAATVLLALLPVALAGLRERMDWRAAALGASIPLCALVSPWLSHVVPAALYARYLEGGAFLLFFLTGAAAWQVFHAMRGDRFGRGIAVVSVCAGMALLATYHQFGAAMAICGAGMGAVVRRVASAEQHGHAVGRTLAALTAAAMIVIGFRQWSERAVLPISPMDAEIRRAASSAPLVLVAQPDQYGLQCRTGQRVMVDGPLAPWIPYMPSLGPSIQKVHWDLYGIRWDGPSDEPWTTVWQSRTAAEWRALAEEYDFNAVLAPATVPLAMPHAVEAVGIAGEAERLYLISR